jgi:hypothetical protein
MPARRDPKAGWPPGWARALLVRGVRGRLVASRVRGIRGRRVVGGLVGGLVDGLVPAAADRRRLLRIASRRMREWPPINSPDVRAWMALGDDEWLDALMAREKEFEKPPFTEAAYQFGLAYPWDRPAHSYLLCDGEVRSIEDVDLRAFTVTAIHWSRSAQMALPTGSSNALASFPTRPIVTCWCSSVT